MDTFEEIYTTIEQSKRLLELGLPANTADCYFERYKPGKYCRVQVRQNSIETSDNFFKKYGDGDLYNYYPCWSVGQLIKIYLQCCNESETFSACVILSKPFFKDVEYILKYIEEDIEFLDFSKLN